MKGVEVATSKDFWGWLNMLDQSLCHLAPCGYMNTYTLVIEFSKLHERKLEETSRHGMDRKHAEP